MKFEGVTKDNAPAQDKYVYLSVFLPFVCKLVAWRILGFYGLIFVFEVSLRLLSRPENVQVQ